MGNCSTRPRVLDPVGIGRTGDLAKSHRRRRSSLGRLADFLTQQSSALRDAVSEKLPTAANRGSQEVINLVEGPGFLEPSVWCAGLDVPVVKYAILQNLVTNNQRRPESMFGCTVQTSVGG